MQPTKSKVTINSSKSLFEIIVRTIFITIGVSLISIPFAMNYYFIPAIVAIGIGGLGGIYGR